MHGTCLGKANSLRHGMLSSENHNMNNAYRHQEKEIRGRRTVKDLSSCTHWSIYKLALAVVRSNLHDSNRMVIAKAQSTTFALDKPYLRLLLKVLGTTTRQNGVGKLIISER